MDNSKYRILVVDDEDDLREILVSEFSMSGFTVFEAASGKAAFEFIEKNKEANPIDAIVSDIRMPGGSGIELLENVRKIDLAKPGVFLATGYSDVSQTEAMKRGANGFFLKPYSLEEIVKTVCTFLEKGAG